MVGMSATESEGIELTGEHRMLLQIRDTLYEGNWDDFIVDLLARAEGRPHVFDTIPDSPAMRVTVAHHLELIAQMQVWERRQNKTFRAEG
jgi:hypothetical protein